MSARRRAAGSAVALGAVTVVALLVVEVTLHPSAAERRDAIALFGGLALLGGLVAVAAPAALARIRSLRLALLATSAVGVLTALGAVLASARAMFLSTHDAQLLLAVGVLGLGMAFVVAAAMSGPLLDGLDRVGLVARRVSAGDLSQRAGVVRHDELGEVAAAVDTMVDRLAGAEDERARMEEERRVFLASLGHDLRSPLAALRAAVEALEDGVAEDPRRYLRSMRHDLDALSSLVDDLFLLARLEAGTLELDRHRVDLTELVDEAVEALAPVALARDVRLRLRRADRVLTVGAERELARVVRNLLDNAIRYAPAGSDVDVTIVDERGPEVRVVDRGPGFAAGFVETAFDRFTRADADRSRATGGAGLGLAVARGVVEAHGGSIWAEPGPGGTVAFRLPVG